MGHVKSFQGFLRKEGYDFERPDINLYNFHPQLFVILATQGIFTGKRDSSKRFILPALTLTVTMIGLCLMVLYLYSGLIEEDYSRACEAFCYMVLLGSAISIAIGFLLSYKEALCLIDEVDTDFMNVCRLGPRYRKPFLDGQLTSWKVFLGWSCFVTFVGTVFIFYPATILVYQSLLAQHENLERPLVFPLWLPHGDAYSTPNYELFLLLESTCIVMFMFSFGGYVYTLFHFLLHYYIMMDMIILDFEVLFDGLDENVAALPKKNPERVAVQMELNKRVGRIVSWHCSVIRALKAISLIYRPSLVYHLMFSSIAICLMARQIAETLDKGGFNFLFLMLATGALLQLWIPCYLGTLIKNKGFAVGDSCFNCGWHETSLGKMVCTDLVLILMRAQMPLFIKFIGQPVVQLETFSAVMSTSYSYFNMLRQSQ